MNVMVGRWSISTCSWLLNSHLDLTHSTAHKSSANVFDKLPRFVSFQLLRLSLFQFLLVTRAILATLTVGITTAGESK